MKTGLLTFWIWFLQRQWPYENLHSEVSVKKQYPARLFPGLSTDFTVDGCVLC